MTKCKLILLVEDILTYLTLLLGSYKVSTNIVDFIKTEPTKVYIMCDTIQEWYSLIKTLKIAHPKHNVEMYHFREGKLDFNRNRKPVIIIDEFGAWAYTSSKDVEENNKSSVYYSKFKLYTYKELNIWKNN